MDKLTYTEDSSPRNSRKTYASPSFDEVFSQLKLQMNLDDEQLIGILKKRQSDTLSIPISIFSSRPLGILEALTKYLHENLNLTYSQIATILCRDQRTIWASCHKASKKLPKKFVADYSVMIPVWVFQSRKYGTLESIVRYLKQNGMRFHEIAKTLNRDQRTVWTAYSRSNKK